MRGKMFGTSVGTPLDREQKNRVMVYARAWNALNKTGGSHIGPITRAGFDVLRTLLWGFHNQHTGRCFPSYEAIAAKAGCVRSTVHAALKVLELAGVLTWIHRLSRAGGRVLRTSNAYVFTAPIAKSENRSGSKTQEIQSSVSAPPDRPAPQIIVLDARSPLDDALIRLGRACGAL